MANSVDPDQTAPLGPICPKTEDHYGILSESSYHKHPKKIGTEKKISLSLNLNSVVLPIL